MSFLICVILLILSINSKVLCAELPSDIKKCPYGNVKCIADSMNDVIRRYPKGISEIGLNPIDNVQIKDLLAIPPQPDRPMWYSFKLLNNSYHGFENTTITQVVGFEKDPTKSPLEIHGQIPSLKLKCSYDTAGRLLLFRYNSSGAANYEYQNIRFSLLLKVQVEYRNGKRYLKIYNLVPGIKVDRWIMWLDDLHPLNLDMTIIINQVMNDNWLEIWNEVEQPMLKLFAEAFSKLLESLFNKVAYDDLFFHN